MKFPLCFIARPHKSYRVLALANNRIIAFYRFTNGKVDLNDCISDFVDKNWVTRFGLVNYDIVGVEEGLGIPIEELALFLSL